jgi:hypothetical protein
LQEEIQETHFGDSSGPVFRMYSKIAEKDDNTMAERWQKDADGILIFVSPQVRFYAITCNNGKPIGRFILCSRRYIPLVVDPGPENKLARYLRFLPQEHLPKSC